MIPPLTNGTTRDHTSTAFRWEIFALGGVQNENNAADADTLANPDNATFDRFGRLWITSDGTQDTMVQPMASGSVKPKDLTGLR